MAKLTLQINDQDVTIDTNDYPEILSEVRSELETEYATRIQDAVSKQKRDFYANVVNPLKSENAQLKAQASSPPSTPSAEPQNPNTPASTPSSSNAASNPQQVNGASASPVSEIDKKIADALNQGLQPLVAFLEDQKAQKIQELRQKALTKYGDEIIADMVSGQSAEEIESSALKAHEAYKSIAGKFAAPNPASPSGNPTPNPTQAPNGGQQPPQNPYGQSPNTVTQFPVNPNSGNPPTMADFANVNGQHNNGANPSSDPYHQNPADRTSPNTPPIDVRSMSAEEYAKHRERLLRDTLPEMGTN